MVIEIFAFITIIILLTYFLWTKNYRFWENRGVPCLRAEFPWGSLTCANPFKHNLCTFLQSLYNAHDDEPVVGFYGPTEPFLLVKDLSLVKSVLVSDFKSFHTNGYRTYESVDPMLRYDAFGTQSINEWKNTRGILGPLFTQSKVKATVPQMTKISKSMVKYIRDNNVESLNAKLIAWKFSVDCSINIGFGVQNDSFKSDKSERCPVISCPTLPSSDWSSNVAPWCSLFLPWLAIILRCSFVDKNIAKAVGEWGNLLLEKRKKENIKRVDVIQRVIQKIEKDELRNNSGISDNVKVAQYVAFFPDGSDTSATSLTFALYDIAKHASVQEKLRQEILAVGNNVEDFDGEKISSLKYLDDCVTESFRLHPVVPVLTRYCTETTKLGTLDIQKGIKVFIPMQAIQTDPKHFPNPLSYNPERFASQEKASRHPALFYFGGGPRICLGMEYGKMYIKVGIISLLLNFKIFPVNELELGTSFFLNSPDSINLKFEPL